VQAFDYIVVGGGSAGCVLAARLSEDAHNKVLLVERGHMDKATFIHIPATFFKVIEKGRDVHFYTSEAEPGLNGQPNVVPQGNVIGGGSSINAMIYIRGHRNDYDGWAQMGLPNWSYEKVLPVFRALEELGLKPACVAGTSIGALMGAGFCAGMDSHEMEDYCLRSFGSLGEVFSRFWRIRPKSLSELKRRGGIRLSQFHLEEILPSFLPETVPETFEGLDVPLSVVAVDIILGEVVVLREFAITLAIAC